MRPAEAGPGRPGPPAPLEKKKCFEGLRAARAALLSTQPAGPAPAQTQTKETTVCIHPSSDSSSSDDAATDQKAWSLVARMPNDTTERFSAGVVRRDDGRLVVSLLNHTHANAGIVQWLGSADVEDASADLDYAVAFAERVVAEYEKPVTPADRLAYLLTGRPRFFARADEAYPGFEHLPEEDPQPTPEFFDPEA